MKLILENKMIDINKKDNEGLNSFWIACICGNGEVMKVLAERGIDIMNTDSKGNNVVHLAASHSNLKGVLKMLLDSNFPMDCVNEDGDTALHLAA
jgi:ankyrin repeat protein